MEVLPESLRAEDGIRFAYGNALRDCALDEALASYGGIADPQTRRLALLAFPRSVESRAPAAAMQAVFEAGLAPEAALNHGRRILHTWTALDPAGAGEFLATAEWLTAEQRRVLAAYVTSARPP